MMNIYHKSQGNSNSFFKKITFKCQVDSCQAPGTFFADSYQKLKIISTQYKHCFQTLRLIFIWNWKTVI